MFSNVLFSWESVVNEHHAQKLLQVSRGCFFVKSGIGAVLAAGGRRLSSNCIKKKKNSKKIPLVNVTEKKKKKTV